MSIGVPELVTDIQQRERQALADHIMLTGLPARYYGVNFTEYKTETEDQRAALQACQEFAEHFAERRKTGTCLTLIGDVGTGKTMLAGAIITHVLSKVVVTDRHYEASAWHDRQRRATAKYTTVMRMLRDIRDTYRKDSTLSEKKVIREFINADLLVLDEVGVQRGTEDERIQLFEILDGRYGELRPSVIISNLNAEGLKTYIGERVFDRLCDNGGKAVVFDWQSQRGRT